MNAVKRCGWIVASLILLLSLMVRAQTVQVAPTVETDPVPSSGDAADDPAIWIHPTNPSLSLIFGTNKGGNSGLGVYDLSGNELQYISSVEPNNVDLRYNFPLGNSYVDIVGISNQAGDVISIFKVDPVTRRLEDITARDIDLGSNAYGFCMYHSPVSGKFYAIVTSDSGKIEQWELFDNGTGKVDARRVRSLSVGSRTEGCVADDVYGVLYFAEEKKAIWKYGAEPGDGSSRTQVDSVSGGRLDDDIEGLTIYYASDGSGYLIASSQGNKEFVVYRRDGNNAYVMTFKIVDGNGIDGVVATDGIDVTNVSLGPTFPYGVFVAQDGANDNGNQNFKLVPWEAIADAVRPPLLIDTSWDPRTGASGGGSTLPVITSFVPSSGVVGTQVTITGSHLTNTTEVTFDGVSASVLAVSESELQTVVPAGASSGAISVTTPEGTDVSTENFTVIVAPSLSAFAPASGPVGTQVMLTGAGFVGTTSVMVDAVPVSAFTVDDDFHIRTTVPPGASSGPISVVNPAGSATSSEDFLVTAAPPTTVVEVRVAASTDDAEEKSSGSVNLTSSDLELVYDGSNQIVGMRFAGVTIPPGATIINAYVQFTVDEASSGATSLVIQGQAHDHAPTFASSSRNISSRAKTLASVAWAPPAWPTVGASAAAQQTPNLNAIVQEMVNRDGWSSGNALVIMLTGTGKRVAESYNGKAAAAPLLHIEYAD
jgi:3-phytase